MEYDIFNKHEASNITKFQHSDRISTRRKALFPAVSDDNSDLGPMSPLSDTNSNPINYMSDKPDKEEIKTFKEHFSLFRNNINNYIIINKNEEPEAINNKPIPYLSPSNLNSPKESEPLNSKSIPYLSPSNLQLHSPSIMNTDAQETPLIESPTKNLKTPHDTSSCNIKIPKLNRKHNSESMHDIETGKHNFSPTDLPSNKIQKLDTSLSKTSKVRTALFPDISLPTRSFYPKSDKQIEDKPANVFHYQENKPKIKSTPTYLCNRRPSNRNRFGQINAGVRHKIKKPKQRKPVKIGIKQAAMKFFQSAQLIEFIKEMQKLGEIRPKLITVLNNDVETVSNDNKKSTDTNDKEPSTQTKRIFKSNSVKDTTNNVENNTKDKLVLDALDFTNDNEQDLTVPSLDRILNTLADEDDSPAVNEMNRKCDNSISNQVILRASKTIGDSDNSILFHHPHDQSRFTYCKERKRKLENKENESADVLLSPTSQMCDMTSGLAINSPKRARLNITNIIDNAQDKTNNFNVFNKLSSSSEMEKQKLFPVFYPSQNVQNKESKTSVSKTTSMKKWKNLSEDQMLLDAGQKRFGFTQCTECEIVYHIGDPSEEIMHQNYHNAQNVLNFKGWKNENIVGVLSDARIIKISPGDPKIWWKKIKDLVEIVNRDLGYYEMEFNIDNSVVFLYIKNKSIVGCLIAEPKSEAYKMLSSCEGIDVCSRETFSIKCGISRIWVSQNNRQMGVGTALMECVRTNFSYGYVLRRDEMALSSPSDLGKLFARKYFQTENFLIYTS